MTNLNEVVLIGRLTKDCEGKDFAYLSNGQARANVSIAVNRSINRNGEWTEYTSYFDVTIWGKLAESLKPNLLKGKQFCIKGFLRQDRWEKNGQKHSRVEVVTDKAWLLEKKDNSNGSSNNNNNGNNYQNNSNGNNNSAPSNQSQDSFGNDDSGFPEDIPF